ncbi:MAG TPA: sugar ABC transporter substrate-binding protein [Bryobacteraceae bacterium]
MRNVSERYMCQAITRACDVLECFREAEHPLRLKEIARRTGLSLATAFRIVFTLEQRGMILRTGEREYSLNLKLPQRRKYRLGFAGQSQEFAFSRTVAESIAAAAKRSDIELISLDNKYSPKAALRNAEFLIREGVELVIEFQTDEHVAPVISSKFLEAKIPIVALEIPHPGAIYYGANNYDAGLMGGRFLGRWAKKYWEGQVDDVLLLALPMAGSLPRSRLTGTVAGIRDILPAVSDSQIVWLDGRGQYGHSVEAVRKYLRRSRSRKALVAAINDPSALGALRAFEEAGAAESCVVMGQNASAEARAELRKPGTRLIGSVAYFPERYGDEVIPLCLDVLQRKPTPPAVFVRHELVTKENVNRLYPNDVLIAPGELEQLLLKS